MAKTVKLEDTLGKYTNFPALYKKTSTGALQFWQISTDHSTIYTRWGQVDGAVQEGKDTIKEGKNVGKANETTPIQQAQAEAKSQWEKKLKKGYVKTEKAALEGEVDDVIEGGFFPMLAHRYDERGDDITFPAFLQPKLDGHRCVSMVTEMGGATLWSRTRKPINSMPHIQAALEKVFVGNTINVDGELYNHDYKNRFEELTHFIRSSKPIPGHEILQYHIYDLNLPGVPFVARLAMLEEFFSGHANNLSPLRFVPTMQVGDEDEMMMAFEEFENMGYEGAIVRNSKGLYVGKRSVDLQKLKTFQDEEFKVIGLEEGRGKLAGHAIFICKTKDGTPFKVKMKGETAELKKYWQKPSLVLGKDLTVKFQGYTGKNKVPRFPVAWRFREDV